MRRLISVLLCVILILSAAPSSFADGTDAQTGSDSEFMAVTGLDGMEKALNDGASIESVYYTDGCGFSVSEFTTTDRMEMASLWKAVRIIRLGSPSGMSITDWYPLTVPLNLIPIL